MTDHPTEARTVQERLRDNVAFWKSANTITSSQLLREAADRIDALEKALGDVLAAVETRPATMRLRKIFNATRAALHPSDNETGGIGIK